VGSTQPRVKIVFSGLGLFYWCRMFIARTSVVVTIVSILTGLYGMIWRPHEDWRIACTLFILGWFVLSYLWWKWSRRPQS
jgi:Mg2+ and Co2+ transporter CorA